MFVCMCACVYALHYYKRFKLFALRSKWRRRKKRKQKRTLLKSFTCFSRFVHASCSYEYKTNLTTKKKKKKKHNRGLSRTSQSYIEQANLSSTQHRWWWWRRTAAWSYSCVSWQLCPCLVELIVDLTTVRHRRATRATKWSAITQTGRNIVPTWASSCRRTSTHTCARTSSTRSLKSTTSPSWRRSNGTTSPPTGWLACTIGLFSSRRKIPAWKWLWPSEVGFSISTCVVFDMLHGI